MSWLHRVLGKDGVSQAAVRKGGSLHVEPRTPGVGDASYLGSYGLSVVTGTLAAALAANAVLFSARWGDATKIAVVTGLRFRFLPLTPFTAATLTDHTSLDAVIGRTFTAAHTGGTALTLTSPSFKRRASFSATSFTDLRVATTAALGGGTVTLDPHPFAQSIRKGNRVNPAAATEEVIQPTQDFGSGDYSASSGDHPIVLKQDEGIVLRNRTVWPAAGTGIVLVELNWAEFATATDY